MYKGWRSTLTLSLAMLWGAALAAAQTPPSPNATAETPAESAALESAASVLQPFTVLQSVQYKSINAGISTLRLTRTAADHWTYSSRSEARGLARLLLPGDITLTSQFALVGGQVQPLRYRGDSGSSDDSKNISFDFDWAHNRVTGVVEREPVSLRLRPGVQDDLSAQIATVLALARGKNLPTSLWVVDKDELKEYAYHYEGTARLNTAIGVLDTVIVSTQRKGSPRTLRTWFAPSLGYVPVKAERSRLGTVEFAMAIRSLKR